MMQAVDFLRLMQSKPEKLTALGYYVSGGGVVFDGEEAASGIVYPRLLGVDPLEGQRVLMLRVGGTWVIIGVLTGSNPLQMLQVQQSSTDMLLGVMLGEG